MISWTIKDTGNAICIGIDIDTGISVQCLKGSSFAQRIRTKHDDVTTSESILLVKRGVFSGWLIRLKIGDGIGAFQVLKGGPYNLLHFPFVDIDAGAELNCTALDGRERSSREWGESEKRRLIGAKDENPQGMRCSQIAHSRWWSETTTTKHTTAPFR